MAVVLNSGENVRSNLPGHNWKQFINCYKTFMEGYLATDRELFPNVHDYRSSKFVSTNLSWEEEMMNACEDLPTRIFIQVLPQ